MSREDGGRPFLSPITDGDFHLFVYGTLMSAGDSARELDGCVLVASATIDGTLYDIDGEYPALMLYGGTPVHGEIWRCPVERLGRLDAYEGVERGLFRRIAVRVGDTPCWTYVAGPRLASMLTPDRRLPDGRWPPVTARRS